MKEKTVVGPFGKLSNPAQRALANAGIKTPEQLSQLTESQVLKFHGMGKASLPLLREALAAKGLSFAKKK
jgi:DNA-directed RNA polymerase alpha subunit